DFKSQIQQMRKMGGMASLMEKMPGQIGQMAKGVDGAVADKAVTRLEGIINSMTPAERRKPELLKASRKRRIAAGAGVTVQEVNRLLKQFEDMQKMMKQFSKGGMSKLMRGMKGMLPGM
ncbi:MAG: signal recognition particle protein, partial [Laribacter sp.]|nr:signal recognition particle protein [Laribacter sp.]